RRALAGSRVDLERSAVLERDAVDHREAEAGPARGAARRIEGLEDTEPVRFGDADAVVLDLDGDALSLGVRQQPEPDLRAPRFDRVADEIDERLLDLCRIGEDADGALAERRDHARAVALGELRRQSDRSDQQ